MTHVVDARPRNHIVEINNMIGCSDRFMWPCRGGVIPAHVFEEEINPMNVRRSH
jgi:hypothetical protein